MEQWHQDNVRIGFLELINYISTIREEKYEEAMKEYYTTRKDFMNAIKMFGNNQKNFETIYNIINIIVGEGATNDNNEVFSLMFYTIRDKGTLCLGFMHENGHIINQTENGCGFETWDTITDKNPYDKAFCKYEKFNETLNDMFTIEAIKYLQNQGIYLIEPKEFTANPDNWNTALITKNLLYPLIQKFRKQVIKAKINAKPEELVKCIGKDNFENLVDAVNKVDYLSRNGVISKIDETPEDAMVLEYFETLERVKQIYMDIDAYYANNFESLSTNSNENSGKQR